MRHYGIYKGLISCLPRPFKAVDEVEKILSKYRAKGAVVCAFDEKGVTQTWTAGKAREGVKVTEETFFRAASVSKMVTAMMALSLYEKGVLDLDGDAGRILHVPLRNPAFPDTVITSKMLLSHTSSLLDSDAFWNGAAKGETLETVLKQASFSPCEPGTAFAYSNFGAGLMGAVMESATGKCIDTLLKEEFPFIQGSFFPQNVEGQVSDVWRILPKAKTYDGKKLSERAKETVANPQKHYALVHGNLCVQGKELAEIARLAMTGYEALRKKVISFGSRDPFITEGTGMFIIEDSSLCKNRVYGHQGLAYGAVNGAFFDAEAKKGFVLLTAGVSESRKYVLADVNKDLIRYFLG